MLTVEAGNGQTDDFIAGSRDTLHLHATFCTDKQDFCFRAKGFEGIRNAQGGEDVPACAATADDDSNGLIHVLN